VEENFASATASLLRYLHDDLRCAPLYCVARVAAWLAITSPHKAVITKKAVGVGVGVGVSPGSPPFAVQTIVPLSPTAIPRNASLAKETSLRFAGVPLV